MRERTELLTSPRVLSEAIRRTELPLMDVGRIVGGPGMGDWRSGVQLGHVKFEICCTDTRGDAAGRDG